MEKRAVEKIKKFNPEVKISSYEIIDDKLLSTVNGKTKYIEVDATDSMKSWDNGWDSRSWNRH